MHRTTTNTTTDFIARLQRNVNADQQRAATVDRWISRGNIGCVRALTLTLRPPTELPTSRPRPPCPPEPPSPNVSARAALAQRVRPSRPRPTFPVLAQRVRPSRPRPTCPPSPVRPGCRPSFSQRPAASATQVALVAGQFGLRASAALAQRPSSRGVLPFLQRPARSATQVALVAGQFGLPVSAPSGRPRPTCPPSPVCPACRPSRPTYPPSPVCPACRPSRDEGDPSRARSEPVWHEAWSSQPEPVSLKRSGARR